MNLLRTLLVLCPVAGSVIAAGNASAQNYGRGQVNSFVNRTSATQFSTDRIRNSVINSSVPQFNYTTNFSRSAFSSGLTGRQLSKPFAGASSGGSVSPWLALSEPFSSSAHNYYTQVRPMLDQQRANQQQAARNQQVQRQLQAAAAQGPYSVTGNEAMAPTGHAAVYMNYGGYYTPVAPTKNR